jgi:hypothetical protein
MYLFGAQIFNRGGSGPSVDFSFTASQDLDEDLPPIHFAIFSLRLGATASVAIETSGKLSATGIDVTVIPSASLGAHISGGVSLLIVDFSLDTRVNLMYVNTPVKAQAGWFINTDPSVCAANLTFSLNGQARVGSGGGEVDLVVTFGIWPFEWSKSWTLFSWDPLAAHIWTLFDFPVTAQAFPLPPSQCTPPVTVTINSPGSMAVAGGPILLQGTASAAPYIDPVPCSNFHWVVAPPDTLNPPDGQGCNVSVTFADPSPAVSAVRYVTLIVNYTFTNPYEKIPTGGFAIKPVTVSSLPAGPYIFSTNPAARGNPAPPLNGQLLNFLVDFPIQPITLNGKIVGPGGTTTWTATGTKSPATVIGTGLTVSWTPPYFDVYTISMNDSVAGSASMTVNVEQVVR